jgi:hypothetical protein
MYHAERGLAPLQQRDALVFAHSWAVKIENNTDWNFRDLEEMLGSAKALKRNNRRHEGILIGPSRAPSEFLVTEIPL